MNLQFFAEDDGNGDGASDNTGNNTGTEDEDGNGNLSEFDKLLSDKANQSEFDKRVSKALEKQRTKLEQSTNTRIQEAKTEAEKLARMNAEQKAEYEKQKAADELAKREANISKRELTATAKETLAEKGLPLSLHAILDYADADKCNASIESVSKAFGEAVEKAVEERLTGGKAQKKAQTDNGTLENQIKQAMMGL